LFEVPQTDTLDEAVEKYQCWYIYIMSDFNIESLLLKIKRDVRLTFWIILGISILLAWPATFLGGFISSSIRSSSLATADIVQPKNIQKQDYIISETQKSDLANGERLLYVTVNNKQNKEVGFWPWVYTIQVLNSSGSIVQQETARSYLLPEEVKFVTITTSQTGETIKIQEVSNQTRAIIYNPEASDILKEPNISIIKNDLVDSGKNNKLNAAITLRNNDNIFIEQMNLLYLVRDSRGAVVGGGTTTVTGFAPGTTRDLNVDYIKPLDRIPRTLELRWSVNYLDPSTIRLP